MKRKIVKHGPSSLTVTLPMEWVRKNRLVPGDEVEVNESEEGILVSLRAKSSKKIGGLVLGNESDEYLRSHIGRFYKYGYDELKIRFDDPKMLKKIQGATHNLIGADIVDSDKQSCVVRIVDAVDSGLSIDKYCIKMLLILKQMLEIIEKDMNDGKYDNEVLVLDLRDANWKYKDYILRITYRSKITLDEFSMLNNILFCYEKIGSNLLAFYRMYLDSVGKPLKNAGPVFKEMYGAIDWLVNIVGKECPVDTVVEDRFRSGLKKYRMYLVQTLTQKSLDKAFLIFAYFTLQLLDSTISYVHMYKARNVENRQIPSQ